jgi:hypothetical protein
MAYLDWFGVKNWTQSRFTRESCSTVAETWKASDGDRVFTKENAPRFMTVNAAGALVTQDWQDAPNTITRNVLQGQELHHIPQTLVAAGTDGTTEVVLEW